MSVRWLRHSSLALAAAILTLAAGPHLAGAVDSPPPPRDPDNPYADDKVVPREMMRQYREREKRDAERKSDEAKAERKASRSKYKDKSKHEALDIARAKFERILTAPAWAGLNLQPGEKLKDYVDDFQALIDVGDDAGDTALVESTLPLLNEQNDPTDLALEPRGDGFAPKAPAVELGLPADVADGVTVAGGQLTVTPVTDATTDAIETEDKVFYANAQDDTDVLVVPKARGFETFHQLRSAESPEQLAFDVGVPGGATLRLGDVRGPEPEDRGIEVVSPGGKVIARISPPLAVGADGEPVDVDYAIDGTRVTMTVAHRDEDVAYPILVDPDFQMEEFRWQYGNRDTYNWRFGAAGGCSNWTGYFGQGWWTFGHILYAQTNWQACGGDEWAEWNWQAPRMSHIYRAEFYNQNHPFRQDCILNALWAPWAGNWDGGWVWLHCGDLWDHSRGHCPVSNDCNPDYGAPSNAAIWKLQNGWWGGWREYGGWAELGGAVIYVRDRDNPVIDSIGQTTDSRWYKAASGTSYVRPRAHDDGLGMNKFQLNVPGRADEYRYHPCVRSRCPGSWSLPNDGQSEFSYSIDALPEGINTIRLYARDALDKITGTSYTVNVDRGLPNLNVYGPLRDAVYVGRWWGTKTLSIQSSDGVNDGNPANHRAGVTAVDIYVDNVLKHRQSQSCFASCALNFNWTLNTTQYSEGNHSIRVVARDGAGNERSSSTWTVTTAHADPGGSTDKIETLDQDGDASSGGAGIDPNMCVDPAMYCGANDANNPAEVAADAEPPLANTYDGPGLPKISVGSQYWGWADQDYKNFDLRLIKEMYKDRPKKFARVIIPWDMLLHRDGVPNTVPEYETDNRPNYKWLVRDPNNQNAAIEKSYRFRDPNVFKKYDRWMQRAQANGWKVMVSFGSTETTIGNFEGQTDYKLGARVLPWPSFGDTSPYQPISYIYNVTKILEYLRTTYPSLSIDYVSAWNEPNHPSYSTGGRYSFPHQKTLQQEIDSPNLTTDAQMSSGAWYAGRYYNYLRKYCSTRGCSVLAGEMVDRSDMERYFGYYKANLNGRPKRWAYHPYLSGKVGATSMTADKDSDGIPNFKERFEFYMRNTGDYGSSTNGADVWFTEVGPLYSGTNGNPDWGFGVKQLQAQMDVTRHRRVKRFYYYSTRGGYEFKNGKNIRHDSGFIDPGKEGLTGSPPNYTPVVPNRAEHIRTAYCTYGATVRGSFVFGRIEGQLTPRVYADDNDDDDPSTKDFWIDGVRGCS